jgi:hypothetical protein
MIDTTAIADYRASPNGIVCPFCGEDDFDQIGLRLHLFRWCEGFEAASNDDDWAAFVASRTKEQDPQP